MQAFNFQSGNATVRHLKELPKPKKKMNTDRVLFIGLLVSIIIYGSYQLYQRIALIRVDGMVTMEKLAVNFTEDVRLLKLNVEEGATVQPGDTLFSYMQQYFDNGTALYTSSASNIERITRDQLVLRRELNEKRTERRLLQLRQRTDEKELAAVTELVALAAYPRAKYEAGAKELRLVGEEVERLGQEVNLLSYHISELEKLKRSYQIAASGLGGGGAVKRYYVAPFDGIIGRIEIEENEVCYKTTDLMAIHKPVDVRVQAYFAQEAIDHIKVGESVDVEFPDGTSQQGIIKKFYIATYALPSEFQKKYEPTERGILVDIVPLDADNTNGWKQFYKMTVKVSLRRFF